MIFDLLQLPCPLYGRIMSMETDTYLPWPSRFTAARATFAAVEDEDAVAVAAFPLSAQRTDVERGATHPALLRPLPKENGSQHDKNSETNTVCTHHTLALVIWLDAHQLIPNATVSLTTYLLLADIDIAQLELDYKMSAKTTKYNIQNQLFCQWFAPHDLPRYK